MITIFCRAGRDGKDLFFELLAGDPVSGFLPLVVSVRPDGDAAAAQALLKSLVF